MPAVDTSYMCTIHKMPTLKQEHHIVGFDALLDNEEALNHTHHFIFRKCIIPPEHLAHFEESAGQPADSCTTLTERNLLWLTYCETHMFVWAKGGEVTTFPENVGFPIAENPEESEFYMIEIHYDNPFELQDKKFKTGMQIYYTDVLRPEVAGIMVIGHIVWWVHTIPPNSPNFKTVGHCPSQCTDQALADKPDGINVFNVLLHSHLSGRQLKLRHFRGDEELSWMTVDMNYNFDYQQNRQLKEERKILKGDHLTYECTTNTEWKNGEITIGDLSTRDEMCEAFIMYYPRIEMTSCTSTYSPQDLMNDFGLEDLAMEDGLRIPIITKPEKWRGRNYTDVMTNEIEWTDELRNTFQTNYVNRDHDLYCYSSTNPEFTVIGKTNYPNVKEYQPENGCGELITTTESEDATTTTTESADRTTTPDSRTTTASAGKLSGLNMILFVILGALCLLP